MDKPHPLTGKWTDHLRQVAKKQPNNVDSICPLCRLKIQKAISESSLDLFERHLAETHDGYVQENAPEPEKERRDWIRNLWTQVPSNRDGSKPGPTALESSRANSSRTARAGDLPSAGRLSGARNHGAQDPTSPRARGRVENKSPVPSLKREGSGSRSSSPSPSKRSRARPDEFDRGAVPRGTLWEPGIDGAASRPRSFDQSNVATNTKFQQRPRMASSSLSKNQRPQPSQPLPAPTRGLSLQGDEGPTEITKQPETRPISQEQLVAEVKGIYAGLVMVENKCIEVDSAQTTQTDNKLNHEQWQALIALHRTLLHEHHDFFLASQHPSASPALRRLASKYAMPARMWRHGIHSFLELLRHRLPASLEHMLTFIYLAYSMMALLYETVPAFEDTWIECLGDLGRYRMAIEDDDIRDREVWTSVSRHWYSKASDKAPTTGRLYHHLAILARPNALQQLYYYTKSLCVAIPFVSARESVMTLFDPIMTQPANQPFRLPSTESSFVRAHGIMFSGKHQEKLEASENEFINTLDPYIARSTRRFIEAGYHMGIAICCAILGYGNDNNPIFKAIMKQPNSQDGSHDLPMLGSDVEVPKGILDALRLSNRAHNIVLRRFGDSNILPYLHVTLSFVYHLTFYPEAMAYVAADFPWKLAALMLNTLAKSCESHAQTEGEQFPQLKSQQRPLPEDYAMRGLVWTDRYFPAEWFANERVDDDEKYFEVASMSEERTIRVLYLGCRIAAQGGKWLRYSTETHQFSVNPQYDIELEPVTTMPITPAGTEYGELPDASAHD